MAVKNWWPNRLAKIGGCVSDILRELESTLELTFLKSFSLRVERLTVM